MNRIFISLLVSFGVVVPTVSAYTVDVAEESLVGDRIVRFVPDSFDATVTPGLILQREFESLGGKPAGWSLNPVYEVIDRGVRAVVEIPAGTSLYGGGEVTGPLLRNGQTVKMWNTDTGMYLVDGGKRLYQTHPWVMGVRPDGSAFGVLFDTFHKAEMLTADDRIEFVADGTPYKTYIIDRESPQAVLK
ncbi:MAG: alpha-glucosidase, partial [Muribaculaceae bacterium]|nr:alpha-glucosidase [Muribaculaceae bacterium]